MSPHCDCVEFRNNFGSSLLSANPCRLDQIPPIPVTCSQPSTQGDVWLIAFLLFLRSSPARLPRWSARHPVHQGQGARSAEQPHPSRSGALRSSSGGRVGGAMGWGGHSLRYHTTIIDALCSDATASLSA